MPLDLIGDEPEAPAGDCEPERPAYAERPQRRAPFPKIRFSSGHSRLASSSARPGGARLEPGRARARRVAPASIARSAEPSRRIALDLRRRAGRVAPKIAQLHPPPAVQSASKPSQRSDHDQQGKGEACACNRPKRPQLKLAAQKRPQNSPMLLQRFAPATC
jgi:hypothetical protein